MEITTATRISANVPGIPRKPLDNPATPKPTYASDDECAQLLGSLLADVPVQLAAVAATEHPLLNALFATQREAARQLVFIASATHWCADERRTAEYLLRNRTAITDGRHSALSLLLAARFAAEMDVRRMRAVETPVPLEELVGIADEPAVASLDHHPPVCEVVIEKLEALIGVGFASACVTAAVRDAVVIAFELAERHSMKRGKCPALLGMRSDARRDARLIARLREEFGDDRLASSLARLLVGADHTPIESALLWWSARPSLPASALTVDIRAKWLRCLRTIEDSVTVRADAGPGGAYLEFRGSAAAPGQAAIEARVRPAASGRARHVIHMGKWPLLDETRTDHLESRISDERRVAE